MNSSCLISKLQKFLQLAGVRPASFSGSNLSSAGRVSGCCGGASGPFRQPSGKDFTEFKEWSSEGFHRSLWAFNVSLQVSGVLQILCRFIYASSWSWSWPLWINSADHYWSVSPQWSIQLQWCGLIRSSGHQFHLDSDGRCLCCESDEYHQLTASSVIMIKTEQPRWLTAQIWSDLTESNVKVRRELFYDERWFPE